MATFLTLLRFIYKQIFKMAGAGLLNKVLKTFLGSKTDRDLKELSPIIEQTNAAYSKLTLLSNDELRAKTTAFKTKIKEFTKETEDKINTLKENVESDNSLSIHDKENTSRSFCCNKRNLQTICREQNH